MKRYLPFLIGGLGVVFIGMAFLLRNGTPDASTPVTNLASTFMGIAGAICLVAGIVTYLLRHDEQIW